MATAVALIIGGAIANAFAFVGTNYFFHRNTTDERKRHDLAVEHLQRANSEYSKERLSMLDYINSELRKQKLADKDFNNIDVALQVYNNYSKSNLFLSTQPKLSDFYQLNTKQKFGEYTFIGLTLAGTALLAYKFL